VLLEQDVAKMTLAALRSDATVGRTLTLAGPKAWTVPEVISLCEKYADERAQVTEVGLSSLLRPIYIELYALWLTLIRN